MKVIAFSKGATNKKELFLKLCSISFYIFISKPQKS